MSPSRVAAFLAAVALASGLVAPVTAGADAKRSTAVLGGPGSVRRARPAAPTTAGVGTDNAAVVYNGQPHDFYWDIATGSLRHAWYAAGRWSIETLDGAGSLWGGATTTDSVGQYNAVIVYAGQLHVWYQDVTTDALRHAWWDGGAWRFETLDGSGATGGHGRSTDALGASNAVVLYQGQPHLWYYDIDATSLRHAWWNGAVWTFETLDGSQAGANGRVGHDVGFEGAVTLYRNQPHVWYLDATAGALRHAWWNGAAWQFETLDGSGATGGAGRSTDHVGLFSAVTLYAGAPHVWYADLNTGSLRHGWWTGTVWRFEILDGPSAPGGNGRTIDSVGLSSAVTLYGDQPHLWYGDLTAGTLRHAWWNGATWSFEILDGPGAAGNTGQTADQVGTYNTVALYANQPHVWYLDYHAGTLRHGWWNGAAWTFETLDGTVLSHPAVTGLDPATGPAAGGTAVTISGTGFTGATSVRFGSVAAAFRVVSDGEVQAVAPAGSGEVDVAVVNPLAVSASSAADLFHYAG